MCEVNTKSTNKEIYGSLELENWANKQLILPQEKFLLNKYLDKSGSTLEVGTGVGRLLRYLENHGFSRLYGCDYVLDSSSKCNIV